MNIRPEILAERCFKFSSVDGGWEKNFYKAVNKEGFDLTEEERQKSWHSFIEYSAINDPEPEPEPIKVKLMSGQDFQDMIETPPQEKPKLKPRERKTYVDGDVEDDEQDGTYVPDSDPEDPDEEYMSDISIQSEY